MIWIFERDGQVVRLETRFDVETKEYVLGVFWCGRPDSVERFTRVGTFSDRLRTLEQQLVAEQWSQIDNPQITYRHLRSLLSD
jgi:hypothetical protein